MGKPLVGLAMPMNRRPGIDADAYARGVTNKSTQSGHYDVLPAVAATSLLPFTFNILWSGMLSRRKSEGVTHFAMIHDDICPDVGWLDALMEELAIHDADIVSAVVPIKDKLGLTSTALDTTGDEWNPRRLTMTEVYTDFPETFTHEKILLNTGLWVCRLDRPWCEKVAFRQQDRMVRLANGDFAPQTKPEDWDFSRQVRACGGTRLYATRRVGLNHEREEWHNRHPWGQWQTDNLVQQMKDTGPLPVVARPGV